MKKLKKIAAILGIVVLAGLYLSTLIFALMDSEKSLQLLQASIYLTITFPVVLYGIQLIYKLLHKNHHNE
ncbi:MAG: hypothetical protein K2M46_02195 [Lachnospiraceae bacterium]|nr:hypothetical protein [Lachnospiraceae bacterium]